MAHSLFYNGTVPGNAIISLAPVGSTRTYQAGYVRITASGGAATNVVDMQLLTIAEGAAVPSPYTVAVPTAGTANGMLRVSSDPASLMPVSVELGQKYQKGFSADAQGTPLGTHLAITVLTAACSLQIEVE
jgi:hypothetical protein